MTTYSLPPSLKQKCQRDGHAMAAIADGKIVDLVYLYEVAPEFDGDLAMAMGQEAFESTKRHLSKLGNVSIGMLCNGIFAEL